MLETFEDAAKLGWTLVHEQEERIEDLGGGFFQRVAGVYRAEKRHDGGLVNQIGSSAERLLHAIVAWESWADRSAMASAAAATVSDPVVLPVAPTGEPPAAASDHEPEPEPTVAA